MNIEPSKWFYARLLLSLPIWAPHLLLKMVGVRIHTVDRFIDKFILWDWRK